MFGVKSIAVLLVGLMSVVSLTACPKSNDTNTQSTKKMVIEMEMDANYSPTDPFENGRLFCVSEDVEALELEVNFQMDGESGLVEIKDRAADKALWSNTWNENVSGDTLKISLGQLQKDKEYVVRFSGTKINHALVQVTFESDLVYEKTRPSK